MLCFVGFCSIKIPVLISWTGLKQFEMEFVTMLFLVFCIEGSIGMSHNVLESKE